MLCLNHDLEPPIGGGGELDPHPALPLVRLNCAPLDVAEAVITYAGRCSTTLLLDFVSHLKKAPAEVEPAITAISYMRCGDDVTNLFIRVTDDALVRRIAGALRQSGVSNGSREETAGGSPSEVSVEGPPQFRHEVRALTDYIASFRVPLMDGAPEPDLIDLNDAVYLNFALRIPANLDALETALTALLRSDTEMIKMDLENAPFDGVWAPSTDGDCNPESEKHVLHLRMLVLASLDIATINERMHDSGLEFTILKLPFRGGD